MKAAIFDLDGTLLNSLILCDVLWSVLGERYLNDKSFVPSAEDDRKSRTLTLKDAMAMIHDKYHIGESADELFAIAYGMVVDFYSNRVQLKKGVREFLDCCAKQGVKMCVASATAPELIALALKHCDIEKYFVKIFSCAEIGKGKECPDVFLQAVDYLGTDVKETWVFEDSLTAIETASEVGFRTVGIYDKFNYCQEKIEEIATEYISETETLMKLVKYCV